MIGKGGRLGLVQAGVGNDNQVDHKIGYFVHATKQSIDIKLVHGGTVAHRGFNFFLGGFEFGVDCFRYVDLDIEYWVDGFILACLFKSRKNKW
jgi:hypothetical protein